MTTRQLCEQLQASQPKNLDIEMIGSSGNVLLGTQNYIRNDIRNIACTDKKGNKGYLPNGPSIEMLIKDKKGKRHVFYFDTVLMADSVIVGMNSRFMATYTQVNVADIGSIKIQDGHKKYHYVQR